MVPLLDGMLGAVVPARTWFAALMSILGVAMLESSGSPPCVSVFFSLCGYLVIKKIEKIKLCLTGYCTSRAACYSLELFVINFFQVGDLLNFLSALFFGVHMLRTEHIARSTNKEKFLPLLGYEVSVYCL